MERRALASGALSSPARHSVAEVFRFKWLMRGFGEGAHGAGADPGERLPRYSHRIVIDSPVNALTDCPPTSRRVQNAGFAERGPEIGRHSFTSFDSSAAPTSWA